MTTKTNTQTEAEAEAEAMARLIGSQPLFAVVYQIRDPEGYHSADHSKIGYSGHNRAYKDLQGSPARAEAWAKGDRTQVLPTFFDDEAAAKKNKRKNDDRPTFGVEYELRVKRIFPI